MTDFLSFRFLPLSPERLRWLIIGTPEQVNSGDIIAAGMLWP